MAHRKRGTRHKKSAPKSTRQTLTITHLAHQGDGVSETEKGKIYVPATLPGETVIADVIGERGRVVELIEEAQNRVPAPCKFYERCGGCSLQHMNHESYRAWKVEQLTSALHAQNIETEIAPLVGLEKGTRRRTTFAAKREGGDLIFGFHGNRSHQIAAIDHCLILEPAIEKAIEKLRILAALIAPKKGVMKVHVLATDTGLDVRLDDFGDWPDFKQERALSDHAIKVGFARLSLGDEVLIQTQEPILTFGEARVSPPAGGFTQAAQASENALSKLVLDALAGKKNIVDLFSGCGTFALRCAAFARVHGVDGDGPAIAALEKAARQTPALKPVTTEKRDLFHRPFTAKELKKFDAIVLDPPRAGATAQIIEIAKSNHNQLVYVSCSPASFARDARLLIDAGFQLKRVTPVDQFLFSPHIELVGVFHKES